MVETRRLMSGWDGVDGPMGRNQWQFTTSSIDTESISYVKTVELALKTYLRILILNERESFDMLYFHAKVGKDNSHST